MQFEEVAQRVDGLAARFAGERQERQQRTSLERADFEALAETGYPLVGVPSESGGLWSGTRETVRPICQLLRRLAHGDSSLALVSAMHPAVLSYWLTVPDEGRQSETWNEQFSRIVESVRAGRWWGTITSEPGSGGDVLATKTVARRADKDRFTLHGQKHFGSGSGIMDFMVTTAVVEGESRPDWFFVEMTDLPWDGSQGTRLVAPWDGQGMAATQSHAFEFSGLLAERIAWTDHLQDIAANATGLIGCLFTAVILGIVEVALETADEKLREKSLTAYEQVEWARADLEGWLARQAYEGMLRAVEQQADPRREVLQGKTAIAELAEQITQRLGRVIGGGSYSRRSPFGHWLEDVRALGFLRPPWSLAYQTLNAYQQPELPSAG